MEVRNCKNCGRLFNYIGGRPFCEACKEKAEDEFQRVKEYVRDNRGATIQQIAEENEVSVQQIQRWIREERLELTENSAIQIACELCGTNIRTGRFCEACKKKVANDLTSAFRREEPETDKKDSGNRGDSKNRMRFI